MKMKRIIALVMATVMVLSLAACSQGTEEATETQPASDSVEEAQSAVDSEEATEKQVIKYWYPFGGDSEIYDQQVVQKFMEDNPEYIVESTYVPSDAGLDNGKLLAAIAGGNVPDVILTSNCPGAYAMAMMGGFEALDEVFAATTDGVNYDDIGDSFKGITQYDGVSYLFPRDVNLSSLYINTDIFEENGLDPDMEIKTLDDLDKIADQLTVADGDGYSRMGFIPWIDGGDDPLLWPYMFGADVFDISAKKINLTDGKVKAVMDWIKMYAEKYDPEKINTFTSNFGEAFSPDHPFMTGKVAMTVQGNWFNNALKIYAPDLHYKVIPIPAPNDGRYGGSPLGPNVYGVPKGAKNVEGAVKFIQYNMQYEIMDPLYAEWYSISPIPSEYNNLTAVKNNDEKFKMYLDIGTSEKSGYQALTIVANELSTELKSIRDKVIYDGIDPTNELSDAEMSLQKQVDKN